MDQKLIDELSARKAALAAARQKLDRHDHRRGELRAEVTECQDRYDDALRAVADAA